MTGNIFNHVKLLNSNFQTEQRYGYSYCPLNGKVTEQKLSLNSVLHELTGWEVYIEFNSPVEELFKLFEQENLLPGILLVQNQHYVGMISRQKFYEYMSRPYSLGLFSHKPIEKLYNWLQPESLVLSENTTIVEATQIALQRSFELVYEPIVVAVESGQNRLIDFHQLLLAHSQIHVLTLAQLQQATEQSHIATTNLRLLQDNHTQLVQNEKMVALGKLVAGIAHEINNPINFVAGNLDYATSYIQDLLVLINLYQKHYPQPKIEIQNLIDKIDLDFLTTDLPKILISMKAGSQRIEEIVCSLRNFSRLDEAQKKEVNIHEGIDSTLLILQHRLKKNLNRESITVIKEYGNIPLIDCYAGQLNQVFMNILSNAIDALEEKLEQRYSKPSKEQIQDPNVSLPDLTLRISTEILNTDYVEIRIADNGLGITEDIRQRIFDPFFTTKPVGQGTGLGLSISYQIVVEKHSGILECVSTPGKGTEFIIKIPVSI
ncbi:ATP-binding protein [Chlorogloeopsis fritschii PCC 9212]|uniref:histidine kinase n=1 Tax=Chlorogloeopsis fritschii PCC 6912 TaxID=211165 RepID=A0A433N989_CHLFR|nr:ATP-binding protein [Chlorogloeopsis fritschii]RUR78328.1 hypothetical protein PCC6912_36700 [Chlorogloeopsis fritschii PCC 6912]